jgi:hypothetical protein
MKTDTFLWAIIKFYPAFVYCSSKEITALDRVRKPLPDIDDVHDDLQEYLIAESDGRANSDIFIGINAMCPTRKKLIVGTEKLHRQALEKRAIQD